MQSFDIEQVKIGAAEIARKHGLNLVVLFGSQATGRVHAESDVDIAVIGNNSIEYNTKIRLMTDFSDVLRREDVEVVDLASASPTLMYVVVRDGALLYEKEESYFLKWKLYAIKIWMETAWLRRLRDKRLIEWAERV